MEPNQMQTNTTRPSVTSQTIKFLFGKLLARYGAKWSGQYSAKMLSVVQQEWLDELKDMTPQDINRGLSTWREIWPPNIIEFKKACIPSKLPPYYREYNEPALPAPVNRDVGRRHLAKIRGFLK